MDHNLISRCAKYLLMLSIVFPFVRLLPLDTDIQPNFLVLALLVIPFYIKPRSINSFRLLVTLLLFVVLLVASLGSDSVFFVRAWPAYITFFFVLLIFESKLLSARNGYIDDKFVVITFFVWLAIGLAQFISNDQLIGVTFRSSTTIGRGWMSVAPEPSYFGAMLYFYAIYFYSTGRYKYVLVAFLATVFIAQSSLAILYFVLSAVLMGFSRSGKSFFITSVFLTVGLFILFSDDVQNILNGIYVQNRLLYLLLAPIQDMDRIGSDISINSRFEDVFIGFTIIFEGNFLGMGFGTGELIKSGWGAIIFQTGIFGLFGIGFFWWFLLRSSARVSRTNMICMASCILVLWSSVTLANPFVALVLVLLMIPRDQPERVLRTTKRRFTSRSLER